MAQLALQFSIRLEPNVHTPQRFRDFSDGFQSFISNDAGFKVLWGSQGGLSVVYGVVYLDDRDMTLDDRDLLANWVREQIVDCTATFGDPEPIDAYELMRDLTELVFEVRNLTEVDRQAGKQHLENLLFRLQNSGWTESED